MKSYLLCLLSVGFLFTANLSSAQPTPELRSVNGAWRSASNVTRTMIIMDGYFAQADFDATQKTFTGTFGGPFTWANGVVKGKVDFNSLEPSQVGSDFTVAMTLEDNKLVIATDDGRDTWTRLDDGQSRVAGAWRVSARENNGELTEVPVAPRRMLKFVSGARFQWVTINTTTGEFFGTGGGQYTLKDGTYTEQIEFFSGNNSRVGLSLVSTAEIKDGKWHHRGKTSGAEPIFQVWSRL